VRFNVVLMLLTGCGAPTTLKTVQTEVFDKSCAFSSCHKGASPAGGLSLEAVTAAKLANVMASGAPTLTLVVPGKPDESYLLQKLMKASPAAGVQMPQNGDPLTADRLALVRDWISAGAKD
jgi:hypothetical protein